MQQSSLIFSTQRLIEPMIPAQCVGGSEEELV